MNHMQDAESKSNQAKRLLVLNFILVSILLSCFTFIVDKAIQAFYPGWRVNIFPILTFLITLECLINRYLRRHISFYSYKSFLHEIVEIILILFLTKFISMLMMDSSIFNTGILAWGQAFYKTFLDWHHFLLFSISTLVWLFAYAFSDALIKLDIDQDLLEQENNLLHGYDRQNARQKLMRLIFFLGFLMIIVMVLLQSNLVDLAIETISVRRFIPFLLLYFLIAFIFLAINQYAIMKARWYFEKIDPESGLFNQWILITVLICIGVILLIIFIPTNISINLKHVGQAFSSVIRFILFILYYLIVIPFTFIFSLLNALFTDVPIQEKIDESFSELTPPPPVITTPLPWLEILKTILYWVIFIGVFIFSIWFYIKNRKPHSSLINFSGLFTWINAFWNFVKNLFKNMSQITQDAIQSSFAKVRTFFANQSIQLPSLNLTFREKLPRQKVIRIYIDWVQWNHSHGFPRRTSQTPFEYADEFISYLPESQEKIYHLTDVFIKARYTRNRVTNQDAIEALNLFANLKDTLLQKQSTVEQINT